MKPTLDAQDVAQFLLDNPQFFETHQDVLAAISLTHPLGGRTVSLTERQLLTLREKARALESKLTELIRFGEENDAIGERVHRLSIALIKAADWSHCARVINRHLTEDFDVPHVALRLWGVAGITNDQDDLTDSQRAYFSALARPYCGPAAGHESCAWFGATADGVQSMCEISLRRGADVIGALVLGSKDPQRFYDGMGTLFLSQIGNLVAAAATRAAG